MYLRRGSARFRSQPCHPMLQFGKYSSIRIDVQHQSVGIVVGLIAHMLKHRRQKLHQEIEQLIAFERGNLS